VKRLGLARALDDPLSLAVRAAGWEPVPLFVTAMAATQAPPPAAAADAAILLSPAAARLALLPPGLPCLAQGEATARALAGRQVWTSRTPRAEGLWDLLRERFPRGGTFLLARGERSREFLEQAAAGTPWTVIPWITHREAPVQPPPAWPALDAVLALSPLQAEILGARAGGLPAFAWGERTRDAFLRAGYPVGACCRPEASALQQVLSSFGN
jgi:uroporphyrinogen-III synthase